MYITDKNAMLYRTSFYCIYEVQVILAWFIKLFDHSCFIMEFVRVKRRNEKVKAKAIMFCLDRK